MTAFSEARSAAQALGVGLQIRLAIELSARELHGVHWELLLDPRDGSYLFAGEEILFSRYLSSLDWQPISLRPKAEIKALVVIANPVNLAQFGLAPVDVRGELTRAQASLAGVGVTTCASGGTATLNDLSAHLRDGGHDILYLVCHGSVVEGEPWLWMEDERGGVARVRGAELVARLKELRRRPRLVVLASCQSAGSGSDRQALVSLGPRLAGAGIPAVVAMQGSVSMETVARFMPVFFRELLRDGQVDRAMAVARGTLPDRADFWMPVLFMRLKSGRIWEEAEAEKAAPSPVAPPVPAEQRKTATSNYQLVLGGALALILVGGIAAGWWMKTVRTVVAQPNPAHTITTAAPILETKTPPPPAPIVADPIADPIKPTVHPPASVRIAKPKVLAQKAKVNPPIETKKPEVTKPPETRESILQSFKTMYVDAQRAQPYFGSVKLKSDLQQNKDFAKFNITIVDDRAAADALLEVDCEGFGCISGFPFELKSRTTPPISLVAGKGIGMGDLGSPNVTQKFIKLVKQYRVPEKKQQ